MLAAVGYEPTPPKRLVRYLPWIHRIRLRLMKYTYQIMYTPGKQLIMADALSRRSFSTDENWEFKSQPDDNFRHRIKYCIEGWPDKSQFTEELIPYWQHNSDISLHNGLLLIGTHIIIPSCMRTEIFKKLHDGHHDLVENCRTCAKFRPRKIEPLLPSEFPECPWQVVGADLLKCKGHWYLIISYYFSRSIEIAKLGDLSVGTIIKYSKSIISRHGVPVVDGPTVEHNSITHNSYI
ncbi:hypothetical protein PR048_014709 [Dryococelus australis]|uniref:Uncharacterized protein n=1 Tax=Dryococelus australis TaxID=614101 RepID=A0ABQ9HEY3_9NEOP|nr:hypothetical protein PR048_014709 [Dryococelus australis]